MEVCDEASYVPHHKRKIAFLFSAMRHFAKELVSRGLQVDYIPLNDKRSKGSFTATLQAYLQQQPAKALYITEPGEWRVLQEILSWEELLGIPVNLLLDDRFFCAVEEFRKWAKGKKLLRLENFYRWMRKKHGILMDGSEPVEGIWNLDKENRKKLPRDIQLPARLRFEPDRITSDVLKLVEERFPKHFGSLEGFDFACSREEAKRAFAAFLDHCLPYFGPYQDAMKEGEYYLFHSCISQYLNCGLLDPHTVCEQAQLAYTEGRAPLQSVEGFIRQVLGWREFIRGIYWIHMPDYAELNSLDAKRPLPSFFWDSEKTDMRCMQHVIRQTEETATSHHIQRLMVTGNFALLAGLDPKAVCEWYLAVYADAYEWVELPNTLGMALFGDGGIVGSKPYAASGAYIHRMSDFCKDCPYNVKERSGDTACPFNRLYWDFLHRNAERLRTNPRMGFAYKNLDRMDSTELKAIRASADAFLSEI
jgi:deoxyribodipyrimidine photolyase-related protein